MRSLFDSLDFAQDVWVSFIRKASACPEIRDERALIAYLCRMAENKVLEEYRHQTTQKNDLAKCEEMTADHGLSTSNPRPSEFGDG